MLSRPGRSVIPQRRTKQWLVALFLAALMLRLLACAALTGLGRVYEDRWIEYQRVGHRLIETGTMVSPLITDPSLPTSSEPSALMPPGYSLIVAAVYALFGVSTFAANLTLQIINAAASSFAAIIVWSMARSLSGSLAAWFAGVLVAIHPGIVGYAALVWDTSVFTLGATLAVWWAIVLRHRVPGVRHFLLYGAFLGLLALVNPAMTLVYPLLVIWSAWPGCRGRMARLWKPVAASVLGWGMAIAPWTIRNAVQFHEPIYVRYGLPLEFWLGVCPEAGVPDQDVYYAQFPLFNEAAQAEIAAGGERPFLARRARLASDAISSDPVRYLRLCSMRACDFWLGTCLTHGRSDRWGIPDALTRIVIMIVLAAESAVLVLAMAYSLRYRLEVRWLAAICVLFSMTYLLTHVQVRFRAPIEPIFAVVCGLMLAEWCESRTAPASRDENPLT